GSWIVCKKVLDEVVGQSVSPRTALETAHGVRPHVIDKGAGRESNLLSHVLHSGSRACIGPDEVVGPENLGVSAISTTTRPGWPAGVAPARSCDHQVEMYSDPAVGMFKR